jgi:uncharacterized cupin superfamily protein
MKFVARSEIMHQQLKSLKTGEEYSLSAVISEGLGSKDLFIHHEILSPGHRTSAPHFHLENEEFVYVLAGEAIVVEGERRLAARAGDSILFERGNKTKHCILNESTDNVELLVVTRPHDSSDVVF